MPAWLSFFWIDEALSPEAINVRIKQYNPAQGNNGFLMMLAAVWPRLQEKQLAILACDYVRDLLTSQSLATRSPLKKTVQSGS